MLCGWRIADPEFSQTPDEMLSGEGAYLYGGRWNSKGTRIAYLASNKSLAAMELLVHLDRATVVNRFNTLEVQFPENLVTHIDLEDLPEGWDDIEIATSLQKVGDAWVQNQGSVILAVPSVVVTGEINYLYNPSHPDAGKIEIGEVEPFSYDNRSL